MSKITLNFIPEMEQIPSLRHLFNIGSLMDVPTGIYLPGIYGESILNGGIGMITGVVGIGNSFKSTIMDYMALSAAAGFEGTRYSIYDTELNKQGFRLNRLAQSIDTWAGRDLIGEGIVKISDKTQYLANEWYEKKKEQMEAKVKSKDKITIDIPFLVKETGKAMKIMFPTFESVDSFTEFETSDVADMQDNNELGDSGANTIFMRQGVSKTRFLQDLPKRASESGTFVLMSAHVGKVIGMDPRSPPPKHLQFLKNGDVIKGVTSKFLFLTTCCWQTLSCSLLINDGTKAAEYPKEQGNDVKGDTDLNLVTMSLLRNKNGPSGTLIQLVVSQQEGVLSTLSEFHYLKTNDRFGFEGNVQNYSMTLMPGVALSRTKVRQKIDTDARLRRAINITSELLQINNLYDYLEPELYCSAKQLYDGIKERGYDWDILLDTRGNYMHENYSQPKMHLTTMDLMKMRVGKYHPYWLADDKKTILKPNEFKKYQPT